MQGTFFKKPDDHPHPAAETLDLAGCFAGDGDTGLIPARCFLTQRPITPDPMTTTLRPNDVRITDDHALAPGSILGRYRIDHELGRGGQATVYRAEHLILRTPAAIKLLHRHGHDADLEALCEEARFAAMVTHPNVVRVSDVVRDQDRAWIVMDYIDGDTLATAIELRGHLDPLDAIDIALDACHGLAAALDCGLIHRDVKPGNLLLRKTPQPNCRALLADFGLARPGNRTNGNANLIAGTPAYMAPEQATDPNGIDHRADIYALGATLYHALTGRPPYEADDPLALIHQHRSSQVPDPRQLIPYLSDELAELVMAMLAKDRADRPADYQELDHLLHQVHDDLMKLRHRPQTSVFKRLKTLFH
jgi:serine/threonine protein kinase